jgi:uncharacterized protein (DUF302 family)
MSTESPYGVRETVDRLIAALEQRSITVIARIDHAGAAREVGLELADEELVIFGDPRVGTLLMQADPAVGLELPLKVLVWDVDGVTRIGYRPPPELAESFAIADRAEVLTRMQALLDALVAQATASSR